MKIFKDLKNGLFGKMFYFDSNNDDDSLAKLNGGSSDDELPTLLLSYVDLRVEVAQNVEANINQLPVFLLECIFFNLSGHDLVRTGIFVCKHWKNVIENETFWRTKCLRDKKLSRKQIKVRKFLIKFFY